jgi:hypothetical protein
MGVIKFIQSFHNGFFDQLFPLITMLGEDYFFMAIFAFRLESRRAGSLMPSNDLISRPLTRIPTSDIRFVVLVVGNVGDCSSEVAAQNDG